MLRVRGEHLDLEPAWSPDGSQIVFTRELTDETTALYVVRSTGGVPRRVAAPLLPKSDPKWSIAVVSEESPSWSPDGRRLAYQTIVNLTGEVDDFVETIFVLEADGTRTRISNGRQPSYEPAWSPDGKRIAFSCEGDLCITDASDPGAQDHLVSDNLSNPSWSPDSNEIVVEHALYGGASYGAHPSALYLVGSDGRGLRKLTFGP